MRWVLVAVLAAASSGCGSSGDDGATSDGGSGGHGGSTAHGGSGGSSGSGGTAASGDSGASGTAGTAGIDCTGTFGDPVLLLEATGLRFGSLTLGADELELIYDEASSLDPTVQHHFRRSIRASKDDPFAQGELLTALDAACADPSLNRSGELSNDGLRLYFGCYESLDSPPQAVRMARRATLDAPFVLDPGTFGTAHSGLAVDQDELTIVTSPAMEGGPLLAQTRATTTDAFGAETTLTGLDGLLTPDLSSDGLHLFASRYTDVNRASFVVADRTGPTTFSTALTIRELAEPVYVVGSATISSDCRSLYYVSVTMTPEYSVMVMKR